MICQLGKGSLHAGSPSVVVAAGRRAGRSDVWRPWGRGGDDIVSSGAGQPDKRYLLGFTTESRAGLGVMRSDGSGATIVLPVDGSSLSQWSWQRLAP